MVPVGYIAKRIPLQAPDWLAAPGVQDVFAVSSCVNDDLFDVPHLEQNGYGVFNSAGEVRARAAAEGVDLRETLLFYYEANGFEYDGEEWSPMKPDEARETQVKTPARKSLKGFDVVTDCDGPNSHSPLSCNSIAAHVRTNEHWLFDTEEEAIASLAGGAFREGEPGPYKIYAVYLVDWEQQ